MSNKLPGEVISLQDYNKAKNIGELREYPDCFEYCLIPNYEEKFAGSFGKAKIFVSV